MPTYGGSYGYYAEMIEAIGAHEFTHAEIVFIGSTKKTYPSKIGNKNFHSIQWDPNQRSRMERFLEFISRKLSKSNWFRKYYDKKKRNSARTVVEELNNYCDILYYLTPSCKFDFFPYIYTLWDLSHLTSFAFPEFSQDKNLAMRKKNLEHFPLKALMVFCETECGRQALISTLKINPDRVHVLPLFPSGVIHKDIVSKRPLLLKDTDNFIHYPAQYWAHKNHYGLICAFREVLRDNPSLKLVLTGSNQGNQEYIEAQIRALQLEDSVIHLGFIALEELKWLYQHSRGLVMPTLLGPSNMPPLEALTLGCPVAVSDLPGHRELLGKNAIYFNPLDYIDIENAIRELLANPPSIIFAAKSAADYMPLLDTYFAKAQVVRAMWGKAVV